jgi:hypothetical protein
MLALKRIPWRKRRSKAQEWARLSHAARLRNNAERGPNSRDAHLLALEESRGMVLRHGVTYSAAHPDGQPWAILRSKVGRTNQVDLHLGECLAFTGSLRTLERAMKRAKL